MAAGVGAIAVPLVVALMAMRDPAWYPVLDRAGFELRLRDITGGDPPLVGVVARLGTGSEQGNHPGPLSFYLMWPAYRLFGSSPWAMQVATAVFQLMALAVVLWLGARRGGAPVVAGLVVTVAVLARGVGVSTLLDPWNPFLSLLWWLAFLLAVWSALDGDLRALPVGALAGSVCGQNHVEYLPLVAGLGGLALVALAARSLRERRAPRPRGDTAAGNGTAPATNGGAGARALPGTEAATGTAVGAGDGDGRREAGPDRREWRGWRAWAGWPAAAALTGVVLWLPPIVDQLTRTPGNMTIIRNEVGGGGEPAIGLWRGTRALLVNADPTHLARGTVVGTYQNWGSIIPALVLLAAWAAAAIGTRRLGNRSLMRLHVVVGASFIVGAVTMSRITGPIWYWLGLWGAVLSALTLFATTWSAGLALAPALARRRRPGPVAAPGPARRRRRPLAPGGMGAAPGGDGGAGGRRVTKGLAATAAALTLVLTAEAATAEPEGQDLSPVLASIVPPTVEALDGDDVPGGGRDGRYLVTSTDPIHLGMHVYGLINELGRAGYDVGMEPQYRALVTDRRVIHPGEATGVIHLSVGPDIEAWRALPGAREVAYLDDRTPAERAEFDRARRRLIAGLREVGREELVPTVDLFLTVVGIDGGLPDELRGAAARMIEIGLPTAVFVAPPGTTPT